MPSTVQEADLQWDWYCTTINTSYTPNTKSEDPSKNAIVHPVLDLTSIRCVPDIHGKYVSGTYVQSRRLYDESMHLTLAGELASRLILLKL